jgi:hypothetical protein
MSQFPREKGRSFEQQPQGELMERRVTARRSDGSTAMVTFMGPHWGMPEISARQLTLMSGTRVSILDLVASKTTWKMKDGDIAVLKERLLNPPPNCMLPTPGNPNFLGNGILAGQKVAIIEVIDQPLGTRSVFWKAPELGCEQLQYGSETKQLDGSYKLKVEARLISLNIGEPEARYFDPAANYIETRPSDVRKQTFDKLGVPEPSTVQQQGERLDRKYSAQ